MEHMVHKGHKVHTGTYYNKLGQEGQNGHIGQGWGDSRQTDKPINK
jgi:hypothetical protein